MATRSLRSAPLFVGVVLAFAVVASVAAQRAAQFTSGVDLVNVGVTVTDKKGNLITGLKAEDFEVIEDGKKQAVSYFSGNVAGGATPEMHLGLLIDVSASMDQNMQFMRSAAIRFLNSLPDALDISVVDFNGEVRVARYQQSEFARLIERIRSQQVGGSTALYDAVGLYLSGAADQDGRKIMLLYTDGADTSSSLDLPQLMDLLQASDVTVYSIGKVDRVTQQTIREMKILTQIAEVTGGEAFFPMTTTDLDGAYRKVLAQVRAQYVLGYSSTNARTDGAWRKVDIRVATKEGRDYRVRARRGYFGRFAKSTPSR